MPKKRNGEVPLPDNWDLVIDENGKSIFVDHNTKTTSWLDPRDRDTKPLTFADCKGDELPYGWEEVYDPSLGTVFFVNHKECLNQLEDPRRQWRAQQEAMLNDYLVTAQEDLQPKQEIFQVKQQRLELAQEEVNMLSDKLTAMALSHSSLNSSSSSLTKYDPELLKADVALAKQRVTRIRREMASVRHDVTEARRGLHVLNEVREKMVNQPLSYTVEDAKNLQERISHIQTSMRMNKQEKQQLLQNLTRQREEARRAGSSPEGSLLSVAQEQLSTASQTDLMGGLQPPSWGEMVRMRLRYDEAKSGVVELQQRLAKIENQMVPGQNESDKDRLLLIQEKEQLLRELRAVQPKDRTEAEMAEVETRIAELREDLKMAVNESHKQIAIRLKLNEDKGMILQQLSEATRITTYLEEQLRTTSQSTLSSGSSLGSLSASSKGSLGELYGSQALQDSNLQDLHRRVSKLLQGHSSSISPIYEDQPVFQQQQQQLQQHYGHSLQELQQRNQTDMTSQYSRHYGSQPTLGVNSQLLLTPSASQLQQGRAMPPLQQLQQQSGYLSNHEATVGSRPQQQTPAPDLPPSYQQFVSRHTALRASPHYENLPSSRPSQRAAASHLLGRASQSQPNIVFSQPVEIPQGHSHPNLSSLAPPVTTPAVPAAASSTPMAHFAVSPQFLPYAVGDTVDQVHLPYVLEQQQLQQSDQRTLFPSQHLPSYPTQAIQKSESEPDHGVFLAPHELGQAAADQPLFGSSQYTPALTETSHENNTVAAPPLSPISETSSGLVVGCQATRSVSVAVSDESVAGDSGVYDSSSKRCTDPDEVFALTAQLLLKLSYEENEGYLFVQVERLRNLSTLRPLITCHSLYVNICLQPSSKNERKTMTSSSCNLDAPTFGESFKLSLELGQKSSSSLLVEVCWKGPNLSDTCSGHAEVHLAGISDPVAAWVDLLPSNGQQSTKKQDSVTRLLKASSEKLNKSHGSDNRVRSVSLDSGYHRQNEGHVGESKFEYQSGDRKVGLRRLTNGKDDKESSDESTVESSQTSTLTRSQGPSAMIADGAEQNEAEYDDSSTDDNADDDETDEELEYVIDDDSAICALAEPREVLLATCDQATNTEATSLRVNRAPCVRAAVRRSKTFSPSAAARGQQPDYLCRLNRSDSDGSLRQRKKHKHFERGDSRRRSVRGKKLGIMPVAETSLEKTSLDLELDLRAHELKLARQQDEIATLKDIEAKLEKDKIEGKESTWFLEDDTIQTLLEKKPAGTTPSRLELRAKLKLEKAHHGARRLRKALSDEHPEAKGFREKMAFFTCTTNIPLVATETLKDSVDEKSDCLTEGELSQTSTLTNGLSDNDTIRSNVSDVTGSPGTIRNGDIIITAL